MTDPNDPNLTLVSTGDEADEPTVHHESARHKRGRGKGEVGDLNLTSMIDVIFQLLIYFVVTASFMVNEGVLTAKLPQGSGQAATDDELPPEKITIELTSGADTSQVTINRGAQNYSSFGQLAQDLNRLRYDPDIGQIDGIYEADNPVVIQPTGFVRWQHVVAAFNSAVAAKYTNVSFAEPKGE